MQRNPEISEGDLNQNRRNQNQYYGIWQQQQIKQQQKYRCEQHKHNLIL